MPVYWAVGAELSPAGRYWLHAGLEAAIVVVEAAWVFSRRAARPSGGAVGDAWRALAASATANGLSVAVGVLATA